MKNKHEHAMPEADKGVNPQDENPKTLRKALSESIIVASGMLPEKWANPAIEFQQDTAEIAKLLMSVLSHPKIPSRFVAKRRTQVTLMHTPGGIALQNNAGHDQLKLNETSAMIWELCTGEYACGQIIAMLGEHYPDAEETIAKDIQRVIASFHEDGVLNIFDPAGQTRKTFDENWKRWIRHNVGRSCDKDEIFKILIDNGFDYDAIRNELNHEPSVSINQIENPLLTEQIDDTPSELQPKIYLANARPVASNRAEIFVLDDFLNEEECERLIAIIRNNLRPSTIISHQKEPDHTFRTSHTCDLHTRTDPLVAEIDTRICRYIGINPSYSEVMQGQYYEVGEEFKPHTDYFEAEALEKLGDVRGERTWTFLIFLNNTERGGGTRFTHLDRTFMPQLGQAITWNNLYQDGRPNPDTLHHAMPVEQGYKAVITKWFRQRGKGKRFGKGANELIPSFTSRGFEKMPIPSGLYQKVLDYYREHVSDARIEIVEGFIDGPDKHGSLLTDLPVDLKQQIHQALKPILEKWSGIALKPTYIYGIRTYLDQAVLKPHRDRVETHIISAILNIDQQVREDWPLLIDDHYYRTHPITMAPGEMILYEGGRLQHGRPLPLKGESYANIFVHYKPLVERD